MLNLLSQHSEKVELLQLTWALQHPYLYTLIKVVNPTIAVIITAVFVINMAHTLMRRKPFK